MGSDAIDVPRGEGLPPISLTPPVKREKMESPFSSDMEDMLAVRVVKKSALLLFGAAAVALSVAGVFGWQVKAAVERTTRKLDSVTVAAEADLDRNREQSEHLADSLRVLLKVIEERSAVQKDLFGSYQASFNAQLTQTARQFGRVENQTEEAGRLVRMVRDTALPQVLRVGTEAASTARAVGDTVRTFVASTRGDLDVLRGQVGSIQTKVLGSASIVLKGGRAIDVHGVGLRVGYRSIQDGTMHALVVQDLETGAVLLPSRDVGIGRSVVFSSDRTTYRLTAQYRVPGRFLGRSMVGLSIEKYLRDVSTAAR